MQRKRKALAGLGDELFSAEPGTFIKLGYLGWPGRRRAASLSITTRRVSETLSSGT